MSEDIKFYFTVLQWVVTGAVAFFAWYANRQAADADEVTRIKLRVNTLEEQMRHLPDQALVNELAGDMKAVKAELTAIRDSIVPLARSMDRINDYLLNRK